MLVKSGLCKCYLGTPCSKNFFLTTSDLLIFTDFGQKVGISVIVTAQLSQGGLSVLL